LASAVGGIYLLTDVRIEGEPLGVAFAFANAALFALYIVVAHRVARTDRMDGIDGLGAAMLVAAIAITPIGARDAAPALLDPIALLAGLGVGISSSVIPYVFDQLAMARLSRATYSLMVSLLPATATVIGLVVLSQVPSSTEIIGVGLVVAAVAVHRTPEPPQPQKVWSAVPHRRASHATISPRGDRSHRRRSHELSQNGTSAAGERGFPSRRRGS
jgi:inner membrane transporter RhtA